MRNFPAKTLRKTTTTCSLCAHSVPLWGTSSSSCANPCPLVCPPHAGCRIPRRTFARHPRPTYRVGVHGADLCGQSVTHRNLLPVRRGRCGCFLTQPARCIPCPSPTTVGQHGGKSQRRNSHVFMDHMGAACPESACHSNISLTILSIVKLQKIVNPIKEFNLKKCKAHDNILNMCVI